MKNKSSRVHWIGFLIFACGVGVSWLVKFEPGVEAGRSFVDVILGMLKILPCAFILISLFEQWVKRETVERHLGEGGGARGYLWAAILAGMSVGGLYVAYPLAYTLRKKGASLRIIFVYLACAGICRIPMTLFEISFLGLPFTAVRLAIAVPLAIITGIALGAALERRNYDLQELGDDHA